MKTAEQWKQQWPGESSQGCVTMLEFIRSIIDDAHRAGELEGMTEAAELCTGDHTHNWNDCRQAILTARDAKAASETKEGE